MNAPRYEGETYYGHPAIKASPYGWKVALYTFLGGLAGAAQAIGALAGLASRGARPSFDRSARLIAAANGALIGPALLVIDLHTPQRWYNMLRIFRRTSPMSIGTYVLTAFGAFSALALLPKIGRAAQLPAAIAGAGMASYTPALLASTATPLWSAAPRALGAEFATGAFASGAAALMLCSRARSLERVACMATLAYGASAFVAEQEFTRKRVDRPLKRGRWARPHKAGLGLAVALPLACFALNALAGRSRSRSALGAAGILAGVFLSRWALFEAGNESARSAADYLQLRSGNG
jgi:formate-dependent nitrite reductase membrane component NrfD